MSTEIAFKEFTIKGMEIETTKIVSMSVHESIDLVGLTSTILLQDSDNIIKRNQISAYDIISISFSRIGSEDEYDPYEFYLRITSISQAIEGGGSNALYKIDAVSPWMYDGINKIFPRSDLNNLTYTDILRKILTTSEAPIDEDLTETGINSGRIVFPSWNLSSIVNYINRNAITKDGIGGFKTYYDIVEGVVKFRTISDMVKSEVTNEIAHGHIHEGHPNSINKIKVLDMGSVEKIMGMGLPRTSGSTFRYDYGKVDFIDKGISNWFEELGYQFLSDEIPLSKEMNGYFYKKMMYTRDHNNSDFFKEESKNDMSFGMEALHAKMFNKYQKIQKVLKIGIELPGSMFVRKVGNLIKVNVPTVKNDLLDPDMVLSGDYLIEEIYHELTGSSYTQKIILTRDGFPDNSRDDVYSLAFTDENRIDIELDEESINEVVFYEGLVYDEDD